MFIIRKQFSFSASHQLEGLPDDHPCGRLHGHNYIVEVILGADILDHHGFVVDYGDLKPLQDYIDTYLDHRHLNDQVSFNPTAELLAKHLYTIAHQFWFNAILAVRVSETPKTWAEYTSP